MRIVLLGDSHLDRVRRDLHRLAPRPGAEVVNAAVGGSFAFELLGQAHGVHLRPEDSVVVSVGTNDAAPWKAVPPYEFEDNLRALLDHLVGLDGTGVARLVYLTPPGVDEARLGGPDDRTAATVASYAAAGAALSLAAGGRVVDAHALLAPLGPRAFLDDGVHLTGAAYDLLLPALAAALS
ncbi:GDSL-like Lipase/Acylhydrolase [Nocardioides dokdonensis FR1436]|uniref:GDSL-like Lipase/Acylhydrolase n=1 Tax=Nocardioides dokdonensis FR1436 TaxID=1300347 RepID=A0A1A9GQB9_9ACTN|nr:SGNH/GDSL hydrolase family protein [Nocardioides dokdonensis]ANH40266.1 GDSL-like Lipase/Acylhydrolase [Nocardioides dokdonensis FR1436]